MEAFGQFEIGNRIPKGIQYIPGTGHHKSVFLRIKI
jgi:hypothetical protein